MYTVEPAYGRKYVSAEEAEKAFRDGKDFILYPRFQYCSIRDFKDGDTVYIKYGPSRTRLTSVIINS